MGKGKKKTASYPTHSDLDSLDILRDVSRESVFDILGLCKIRILESGEVLMTAGQTNRTMFVILHGELSVYLERPEKELIATLKAGQTVGEISVIDGSPASAEVVAATRARLLAVDEETFWRLVGISHEFAVNLLILLAERTRVTNSSIAKNIELMRRFERDALVDGLTGLHNRRWLDDNLSRLINRHLRSNRPMSIIILDVDHFKKFNDDFGHLIGDKVLASVARSLATDLRPTDLAARYGGEEFVVILSDTDSSGAIVAAERLRTVVKNNATKIEGDEIPRGVTISLGVTELKPGDDSAAMLMRADAALYQAKNSGRDRVVCG